VLTTSLSPTDVILQANTIFEGLGILAFALSGLLAAARKKLDLVGLAMTAGLTAFGGGTMRDVLLDRRPFFWVENVTWVYVIIGLCVLAMLFMRSRHLEITERAMQWPDAIGLGVFAAGGTAVALEARMPAIIAVLMGTFTAMLGGVLRDIIVNEIPKAFIDHKPYTVIAFTGAWLVVIGYYLGFGLLWSEVIAAALIIILRILALAFKWRLPEWKL
jgi:uncharacterized membrane protein YeiH